MENASKALIMAAEVLIGVMILGVGVYLFNMFASYSSENYEKIEATQIAEFNAQFLIFYGEDKDGKPIECTIHNIVSLANLAQKNNIEHELVDEKILGGNISYQKKTWVTTDNSLYVQIDLGSIKNLELKSNNDLIKLMKENDLTNSATGEKTEQKLYKCTVCEPRGSGKRINYVKFVEVP